MNQHQIEKHDNVSISLSKIIQGHVKASVSIYFVRVHMNEYLAHYEGDETFVNQVPVKRNRIMTGTETLKLGETKIFENYSIEFKDLQLKEFKNYKAVIGDFKIENSKNNSEQILKPEIRIYENPSTLTYEASIRTGLLRDYYITMSNIDRSDYYNIKFQKKPLMIWIWISVIFISLGGFLRFFKNAKKIN